MKFELVLKENDYNVITPLRMIGADVRYDPANGGTYTITSIESAALRAELALMTAEVEALKAKEGRLRAALWIIEGCPKNERASDIARSAIAREERIVAEMGKV